MSVSPQRIRESRDKALGILKELSGLVQEVAKLDSTETGVATRSACLSVFASRVKFVAGELGRLETCLTSDFTEAIQRSNLDANRTTIGLPPDSDTMHHWCLPVGKQFLKWFRYHVFQHVEPFRQTMTVGSLFTETTWKDLALQVNLLDGDTLQGLASDVKGDVDNAWLKDAPAYRTLRDAINAEALRAIEYFERQAEAGSPPSYLTAMNDVIEGREQRDRAARQVAFQLAVIQGHEQAWNDAWEEFSPALVAYLNGDSSGPMVEALALLDGVIDSVGFDDQLAGLAGDDAFRTYDNERDQIDAAVCRFVVGVWAAIRFDRKETETLVTELDGNAARLATDHVGFVRDVIEAGKLTECDECGRQLTPSQVGRGRCCDCIARQRKTLRWLGIAIECEYRYDNRVYGDGFDAHFPEWSRWRRRLRECYGRDRTDWQLWEDWIGYAQEHRGMDEQRFKGTLRSEAESLLPLVPVDEVATARAEPGRIEAELVASGNGELPETDATETYHAQLQKLSKRHRHALHAFAQAEAAIGTSAERLTLERAWEWVEENYDEYAFTGCKTFCDYVTQARGKVGMNVNQPRSGRTGRSIKPSSKL